MGRLKKIDIEKAMGNQINPNQTILCSDAHVSYKGFAIDNNIEHHVLKAIIKQRVKTKYIIFSMSTQPTIELKNGLTIHFGEYQQSIYSNI